jgi:large subunit ribosomal protein L10
MARPEKVAVVDEIREKLAAADAAVLTEYRGLKVGALAELRGALRSSGTEFKIFKNTLARRAAEDAGLDDLVPLLGGPTAIAFVRGDAVVAAKALRDFGRAHPELVVKGGLLGERTLVPADISALAEVPPRDELLARLAGGFQAPLTKAAGLFQAFTRNFAYGVKALIDQRVEGGEELPAEAPAEEPTAEEPAAEVPAEEPTGEEAPAGAAEREEAAAPAADQNDETENTEGE